MRSVSPAGVKARVPTSGTRAFRPAAPGEAAPPRGPAVRVRSGRCAARRHGVIAGLGARRGNMTGGAAELDPHLLRSADLRPVLAPHPAARRADAGSARPGAAPQAASRPARRALGRRLPLRAPRVARRFGVQSPRRRSWAGLSREGTLAEHAREEALPRRARVHGARRQPEPRPGPVADDADAPARRPLPARPAPLAGRAPRPASNRPRAQAVCRSGTAPRPQAPPGGRARRTAGPGAVRRRSWNPALAPPEAGASTIRRKRCS
jgi:hypothetical protein